MQKIKSNKKIALIHDALCDTGGAERVFQYLCEEFYEADIYTSCYLPDKTLEFFKSKKINVTNLNRFIKSSKTFRLSYLFLINAMKKINLSEYDIVISSSASVAKYVTAKRGKHFSYCYYPTRAIWESDKYFQNSILKYFLKAFLPFLKRLDYNAAQKVDRFLAISNNSRKYIKKYYGRNSDIIYCPIDCNLFSPKSLKGDQFLIVSRLVKWKKIDHAIEAFNKIGYKLKIIGTGEEEKALKNRANPNIEFMGYVNDKKLAEEYAKARAVIFTPHLEYGLIPLEANASGTPVIAYGYGGITETMIPHNTQSTNKEIATAIFYYKQTAESLINAIEEFEKINFEAAHLVNYAKKWDIQPFKSNFRSFINNNS